jgi:hypothetical protein
MDPEAFSTRSDMKRLGILTLLALSLLAVVPLHAEQTAASPLVITVEDEATDLASLGAGGVVYSALLCRACPAFESDCLDTSYAGLPCSDPSMNCSCKFCNGEFGCYRN